MIFRGYYKGLNSNGSFSEYDTTDTRIPSIRGYYKGIRCELLRGLLKGYDLEHVAFLRPRKVQNSFEHTRARLALATISGCTAAFHTTSRSLCKAHCVGLRPESQNPESGITCLPTDGSKRAG